MYFFPNFIFFRFVQKILVFSNRQTLPFALTPNHMVWLDEITYGRSPPIRSQQIRRTDDHVTSMSQLKLMTSSINCSSHYDMKSSKRTFKTKPNRSHTMNLIGLWSDQSEACIACQCINVQKANILCEMSFFAEATYLLVLFRCWLWATYALRGRRYCRF